MFSFLFSGKKWAKFSVKSISVFLAFCLCIMCFQSQSIAYAAENVQSISLIGQDLNNNQDLQQQDVSSTQSNTSQDSTKNDATVKSPFPQYTDITQSSSDEQDADEFNSEEQTQKIQYKSTTPDRSYASVPSGFHIPSISDDEQDPGARGIVLDTVPQEGDDPATEVTEEHEQDNQEEPKEEQKTIVGAGTAENPYLVGTADQWLNIIGFASDKHIRLTNNIDLSNKTTNNEIDFSGVLDGAGHTISRSNWYSDQDDNFDITSDSAGLFSNLLNGAVIKNLNIDMIVYSTDRSAGLIAKRINNDAKVTIQDVSLNGNVKIEYASNTYLVSNVGGAIGYIDEGANVSFIRVENNAAVSAKGLAVRYAGGLVGYSDDASVSFQDCSNNESAEISAVGAMSVAAKVAVEVLKMAAQSFANGVIIKYIKTNADRISRYMAEQKIKQAEKAKAAEVAQQKNKLVNDTEIKINVEENFDDLNHHGEQEAGEYRDGTWVPKNQNVDENSGSGVIDNANSNVPGNIPENADDIGVNPIEETPGGPVYKNENADYLDEHGVVKTGRVEQEVGFSCNRGSHKMEDLGVFYKLIKFDISEEELEKEGLYMSFGNKKNQYFIGGVLYEKVEAISNDQVLTLRRVGSFDKAAQKAYWRLIPEYSQCFPSRVSDPGYNPFAYFDLYSNLKTEYIQLDIGCLDNNINLFGAWYDYNRMPLHDGTFTSNVHLENIEMIYRAADYAFYGGFSSREYTGLWDRIKNYFAYQKISSILTDTQLKQYSYFIGADDRTLPFYFSSIKMNAVLPIFADEAQYTAAFENAKSFISTPHPGFSAIGTIFSKIANSSIVRGLWTVVKYTGVPLSIALAQVSNNLNSAQGGDSALHYNAYAGGLLAYYEADSPDCKLNVNNCLNSADVTGGHNAGGLVGYSEEGTISFDNCYNDGTVSVTDKQFWPASGGILGSYKDGTSNSELTINKTVNAGPVLSKEISGGIVGHLNENNLVCNITNSGSASIIAATNYVGGIVGFEDSVKELTIENCFSYNEYDTTTFDSTSIGTSWFTFGRDINIASYTDEDGLNGDEKAGALIGCADDNKIQIHIYNTYYKEGNKYIGRGLKQEGFGAFSSSKDDFYVGAVTYKLNNNATIPGDYFGQPIDNLEYSNGEHVEIPIPGIDVKVYKDEYSSKEVYSNYNPRTTKIHHIEFFRDNVDLNPDIAYVNVKDGTDFSFEISSQPGYEIDKVFQTSDDSTKPIEIKADEDIDIKQEVNKAGKELELNLNEVANKDEFFSSMFGNSFSEETGEADNSVKKYILKNVNCDLIINITSIKHQLQRPAGLGTIGQPYILTNAAELNWFNQEMSKSVNNEVYANINNDIDYSGRTWNPIFPYKEGLAFKGVINGNGHTISNLDLANKNIGNNQGAFFMGIEGGQINDLTLSGKFSSAAFAYSARNATFKNCIAKGSINSSNRYCGGICAVACESATFESCVNEATIEHNSTEQNASTGGILGSIDNPKYINDHQKVIKLDFKFNNCQNHGFISANDGRYDNHAGGIVGLIDNLQFIEKNEESLIEISHCSNTANISDNQNNLTAGGIVSWISDCRCKVEIKQCINNGNIGYTKSGEKASIQTSGGILGCWNNSDVPDRALFINQCITNGNIWASGDEAGGFVGCLKEVVSGGNYIYLYNSASLGYVSGDDLAGSLVGGTGDLVFSAWDSAFKFINSYYLKYDGLDAAGGSLFWGNKTWDKTGKMKPITSSVVQSGELTYYLNLNLDSVKQEITFPNNESLDNHKNDVFGQNIDTSSEYSNNQKLALQNRPMFLSDTCLPVYYNSGYVTDKYVKFTNVKPPVDSNDYFDLNIKIEGPGKILGVSKLLKNSKNVFYIQPDPGCAYDKENVLYNDNALEIANDNAIIINPDKAATEHKLSITFKDSIEPKKGSEDYNYVVNNLMELNYVAMQINAGYDLSFELGSDIVINSNVRYKSIGTEIHPFTGKFRGNGHTITNYISLPIFGILKGAVIDNFKISQDVQNGYKAALAYKSLGSTVSNVKTYGSVVPDASCFAGLICEVKTDNDNLSTVFNYCTNSINNYPVDFKDDENSYIGGFVATVNDSKVEFNNCTNNGRISSVESKEHNYYVGGFVGACVDVIKSIKFNSCVNNGSVFGTKAAAGFIALLKSNHDSKVDVDVDINNSINRGFIKSFDVAAGIVAYCKDVDDDYKVKIKNSENCADIKSIYWDTDFDGDVAAGIFGYANDGNLTVYIENCVVSSSEIYADGECVGGVFGDCNSVDDMHITDCLVYVDKLHNDGDDTKGVLIGNLDDWNSSVKDNYYFSGNWTNEYGDAPAKKFSNNKNIEKNDLTSGYYANFLSNKTDNKKIENLGQVLDLQGSTPESTPHIGSPTVHAYKVDDHHVKYSNYSSANKITGQFLIQTQPAANSSEAKVDPVFIFNNFGQHSISFTPKDSYCVLESVQFYCDGIGTSNKITYEGINNNTYVFSLDNIVDLFVNCNKTKEEIKEAIISTNVILNYKVSNCKQPAGDGSIRNPMVVKTPQELNYVSKYVASAWTTDNAGKDIYLNNGKDKVNVVLANDIDLANMDWTPIGLKHNFYGSFDGRNHTIKNLDSSYGGLFGEAKTATIQNLKLEVSCTLGGSSSKSFGALVNNANSCYIKNVHVSGVVCGSSFNTFGGIVGTLYGKVNIEDNIEQRDYDIKFTEGTRIYDCTSNLNVTFTKISSGYKCGGIVGRINTDASVYIDNCINNTNLKSNLSQNGCSTSEDYSSGIIAFIPYINSTVKVYNCINGASIMGYYSSGICSSISDSSVGKPKDSYQSNVEFKNNTNKGKIAGKYAAGILSCVNCLKDGAICQVNIEQCSNQGAVNAYNEGDAAGIVSCNVNNFANISICNCSNIESVSSDKGVAAGIFANSKSINNYSILNTFNIGKITSFGNLPNKTFPIVNFVNNETFCKNCYFKNDNDEWSKNFIVKDQLMDVKDSEVKNGKLCYKLCNNSNIADSDKNFAFGQIIDKYDCEKKDDFPVIGSPYKVYHDAGSEEIYTNWNGGKIWLLTIQSNEYGSVKIVKDDGSLFNIDSENIYLPINKDIKIVCKPHDGCVVDNIQILDKNGNIVKDRNKEATGESPQDSLDILDNVVSFNKSQNNYTLKAVFSKFSTPTSSSSNDYSITYDVNSYLELAWVANEVNKANNTDKKINVNLNKDISIVNSGINSWPGLGTSDHPFKGEFNGNGHIISGISMYNQDVDKTAFIRFAKGATIDNFKLNNIFVYGSTRAAGLVYSANNCKIKNVTVSGDIRSSGKVMGGIVGELSGGSSEENPALIESCINKTTMSEAKDLNAKVGGIVGVINNGCYAKIKSCENYGNIYSNSYVDGVSKSTNDDYAGGIVGYVYGSGSNSRSTELSIISCVNSGYVRGNIAGGMLATVDGNDNHKQITELFDCVNYGKVCGDHCGGMLGRIDDCDDESKLNLNKCINFGYVGIAGGTIRNAGGLLGMIDDRDLDVNINSSMNIGPVFNLTQSGTGTQQAISGTTTLLSAVGIVTAPFLAFSVSIAIAATNPATWMVIGLWACWSIVAYGSLTGFIGSIQGLFEDRLFVCQYAGGICSQFNHCNKLNMNNVINYTSVSGETYTGPIAADWSDDKDDTKICNVFAVGNSNKFGFQTNYSKIGTNKSNTLKDFDQLYLNGKAVDNDVLGEIRDSNAFSSGEIGFRIQELERVLNNDHPEKPNTAKFGQIIDKLSEGGKMFVPEFDTADKVQIYRKIDNNQALYYSNYNENLENYQANIKFKNKNEDGNQYDLEKIHFDIKADGDRSTNLKDDISTTANNATYEVRMGECFHAKIKPKYGTNSNKEDQEIKPYSLYDISVKLSNSESEVIKKIYNSDGTITKYINAKFLIDPNTGKEADIPSYFDYKFDYALDGSVEISSMLATNCNVELTIETLDNPIQVHNFGNDDQPTILFPWNSEKSLPNEANNFYLFNDVEINSIYTPEEGDTKLCLNGHSINFKDNGCVKLNQDNKFAIDDCNQANSTYTYKVADNNFEIQKVNEGDKENETTIQVAGGQMPTPSFDGTEDETTLEQTGQTIDGGVIYANGLDAEVASMFVNDGGSLNIYKANIFKPVDTTLISYNQYKDSLSSYIGCNIYRPVHSNEGPQITVGPIAMFNCQTDFVNDNYQFMIGRNFVINNINSNNEKDTSFEDCDFEINRLINSGTTGDDEAILDCPCVIGFDSDYTFDHVFNIKPNINSNVVITSGFDKFIKQDFDYKNIFKINDSEKYKDYGIALSNSGENYNEIAVCKSDLISTVFVSQEGRGRVTPSGELSYVNGSNGLFHYQSEFSNVLTTVTDSKISTDKQSAKYSENDMVIEIEKGQELKNTLKDVYCQSDDYVTLPFESTINTIDYQGKTYETKYDWNVNTNLKFKFDTLTQTMINPKNNEWINWISNTTLPTQASDDAQPFGYKLTSDVHLTDAWTCPVGCLVIDLNGHDIIQDVDNKNVIIVDNEKSSLAIMDSCPAVRHKHYFIRDNNGKYTPCEPETPNAIDVYGGLITGANFSPDRYYKYELNSGAVVVNNGTFILHSGNIAGNNVNDLNGAAGIAVGKEGYVNICKDARICCNSINGDPEYDNKFFAAGVASYGTLSNEGIIDNNYANSPGASGVAVVDGKFDNLGTIMNNYSTDTNECSNFECYGAVYNAGYFVNAGNIFNNTASFICPAIFNAGTLALNDNSQIYNNSYCDNDYYDSVVYDIKDVSNYAIEILSALKTKHASVLSSIKANTITNKWYLAGRAVEDVFKHIESVQTKQEGTDKKIVFDSNDGKVLALNNNGEVSLTEDKDCVNVSFTVGDNGSIDCINDKVTKDSTIKMNCTPNKGYVLDAIIINGQMLEESSNSSLYNIVLKDEVRDIYEIDSIDICVYFISENDKEASIRNWYNSSDLPDENGTYVLQQDIVLSDTWVCPGGTTNIDLNGHNIFINRENRTIVKVDSVDSILNITDSQHDSTIHYVKEADDEYVFTDASGITDKVTSAGIITGGIIGGAIFNNQQNSGAVYINKGQVFISQANIALNRISQGSGAAGINVSEEGKLELNQSASVCFNRSYGGDSSSFDKVSSAILNKGILNSNASIVNNYADRRAVAGICNQGSKAEFTNNGIISYNFASHGSVAGVYSKNTNKTLLQGSIIENIAEEESIAAISFNGSEQDKCLQLLNVNVNNNTAHGETSIPGIYVDGKVVVDSNTNSAINISHNTYDNDNKTCKDIVLKNCNSSLELGSNFSIDAVNKIYFAIQSMDDKEQWTNFTWQDKSLDKNKILTWFCSAVENYNFVISGDAIHYQYGPSSVTLAVNSTVNGNGQINVPAQINIDKEVNTVCTIKGTADFGSYIKDVKVNDVSVPYSNWYEVPVTVESKDIDSNVNIVFEMGNFNNMSADLLQNLRGAGVLPWTETKSLPDKSGSYILTSDVVINDTWFIKDQSDIQLDLNGHMINTSFKDNDLRNVINVVKGSKLTLSDHSNGIIHKYVKKAEGNYVLDDNHGNIEIEHGALYNSKINSGFTVFVDNISSFVLDGANIIGNRTNVRAGAVDNHGQTTINETSVICGNTSQVGAAIYNNVDAELNIFGKITDNKATLSAGGVFNYGKINIGKAYDLYNNHVVDALSDKSIYQDLVINGSDEQSFLCINIVDNVQTTNQSFISFETTLSNGTVKKVEKSKELIIIDTKYINLFVVDDNVPYDVSLDPNSNHLSVTKKE